VNFEEKKSPIVANGLFPKRYGIKKFSILLPKKGYSMNAATFPNRPEVLEGPMDLDREWVEIREEIRSVRQQQLDEWGGISDLLLTNFITGRCTEAEKRQVEGSLQRYPKVREWHDIVVEVLEKEFGR